MIIKRFEEITEKFPNNCAVKTIDLEMSYQELHDRTNNVAAHITALYNVNCTGDVELDGSQNIALLFQHGVDMIVGVLAALKAGKCYVPFDVSYPEKRLAYMLENSDASLLVTNSKNMALAKSLSTSNRDVPVKIPVRILNIDELPPLSSTAPAFHPIENPLAYLLYTSGSTGKPKGVIQSQENILHFIDCYRKTLSISERDRLSLFSAFSHDAAVMDIYSGLLSGATLFPLNIKEEDIMEIPDWFSREKITVWHSVPTLYRYFVNSLGGQESFPHLRCLVMGGEAVLPDDVARFKKHFPTSFFVNLYGQSESSYNSSQIIHVDSPFDRVLLGEPIEGVDLMVIDEDGEEVPPLREGEIVVINDHVALGYWKAPDKTAEVFEADPELGKLYYTGDRGRLLLDGNIEFTGRIDFQVKIRGYRVELGEIESALLTHDAVKEAVVVAGDQPDGNKFLFAYVAPEPGKSFTVHGLREYLSQELLEHMVPSYFVQLEKLPVTPTGKIDRKALPELEGHMMSGAEYAAPTTVLEKQLVYLWQNVLGTNAIVLPVGIDDNFFEIGGHSLRATVLAARLHKTLHVEFPLREIFRTPTIRGMARYIESADSSVYSSIKPAAPRAHYPVSSAQKRLFALNRMDEESIGYNMPAIVEIGGPLDKERLENAFHALINRHESLRSSFLLINEEPVQVIHSKVDFKMESYPASGEHSGTRSDYPVAGIINTFIRPFDLTKSPLLRAGLIELEESGGSAKFVLMYDMHHIISDGSSKGIIIREIVDLYRLLRTDLAGVPDEEILPPLKLQYKDYAVWQQEMLRDGVIASQGKYWLELFQGEVPVLQLHTDFPRPPFRSFEGRCCDFHMNAALSAHLKSVAGEAGASLYMVLCAIFNILLSRYSGQEDIVLGTGIAGRHHGDLQDIVGMFVNTLCMRNFPSGNLPVVTFLQMVKENTLKAFENQDFQFEELVERLELRRDLSRNPLFDVMFVLQNIESTDIKISALTFRAMDYDDTVAKFDLSLYGWESDDILGFTLEYSTALFKPDTIQRLTHHFVTVAESLAANPMAKISQIEILSDKEKHLLLVDFNDSEREFPGEKTVIRLFEEQVAKRPGHTAITGANSSSLTYGKLNEKANRLALLLMEKGVLPGSITAVLVEHSLEMFIGIFAVLKAGSAYLPIDPTYPPERIRYMLADCNTSLLLSQKSIALENDCVEDECNLGEYKIRPYKGSHDECRGEPGVHPDFSDRRQLEVVYIGESQVQPTADSSPSSAFSRPHPHPLLSDPAYVIYTSGSTGRPKGVLVEHRALSNLCSWHNEYFEVDSTDRATKYAGFGFDASVWEIFPYLVAGAGIFVVPGEFKLDPEKLVSFFAENRITIAFLPTQLCEQFIKTKAPESLPLRVLLAGGDKLREHADTNYLLVNNYGPTENTVVTTSFKVTAAYSNIPIGKPIANSFLLVLDKYGRLQPVGVPGELYITGAGLARGYLNKPELTAEKFAEASRQYAVGSRQEEKKERTKEIKEIKEKEEHGRHGILRKTQKGSETKKQEKGELIEQHVNCPTNKSFCGAFFKKRLPEGSVPPRVAGPPEATLYKTGDLVRWLPDGNLEFLGRTDFQVKV
ncbi:MAG: amino acid adenylation domain-containing protein, partial [bacterium]|nr:amino acid adenylation domain-containing protein [bacterium]